jgi:hypothetical protein
MAKKTTTTKKAKTAKAAPKAAAPKLEVRKDGQGRFWVVPKDGGAEHGPFDTRKAALDAKKALAGGAPAPAAKAKTKAAGKKAKPPKEKRLSAIDAAAQVLAKAKAPMNAKELIEKLEADGLWTSPGGKTPHATLYSAIIREISLKGKEARFVKTERGRFAAKA